MNPLEFYNLAVYLVQNSKERPAAMRTCISRAYYSAFLIARDKAGITSNSGSVHKTVIDYYLPRNKVIHNRLKNLSQRRGDADYDMKKPVSEKDAGIALNICKEIIEVLKT
jgi:uncharacterized protein (UPF0332 family)